MRALDGTYWTWRWAPGSFARLEVATKQEVLDSYGKAMRMGRPARFRPRMSIVRAVRLLTEARARGVELWMQQYDNHHEWLTTRDMHGIRQFVYECDECCPYEFAPDDFLTRWIVATPEDARRIDARGKR